MLHPRRKSLPLPRLGQGGLKRLAFHRKAIEERKDKRGHRRCYDTNTGKQVKCPERDEGGDSRGGRKPAARRGRGGQAPTGPATPGQQQSQSTPATPADTPRPGGGVSQRKVPTVGRSSKRKRPVMDRQALRDEIKRNFEDLVTLPSYRHRVVPLSRLYQELERSLPGLTPEQFKEELWRLSQERGVQLHMADSYRGLDQPEVAIRSPDLTNPAWYAYVLIPREREMAKAGKEPPTDPDELRKMGLGVEAGALLDLADSPLNTPGAQKKARVLLTQYLRDLENWDELYDLGSRLNIRVTNADMRDQVRQLLLPPPSAAIENIKKPARDVISRMFAGTGEFGNLDPWTHDWSSSTPELRADAIEALKEIAQEVEFRGHNAGPVERLIAYIGWQASRRSKT